MIGKLKQEDFLQNRVLTNLKTDENGKIALFSEIVPDLKDNRYRKVVKFVDLESMDMNNLEIPFEPDDYLPENGEIIFKVINDGDTDFHSFNPEKRTLRLLFTIPFPVKKFAFDRSCFYFTAEVPRSQVNDRVFSGERSPFFIEGRGPVNNSTVCLFRSEADGNDINMISTLDNCVDLVDFAFEEKRILYTVYTTGRVKPPGSDLYLYDMETGTSRNLLHDSYRIFHIEMMATDLILMAGVDLARCSRNDNPRFYRVDEKSGRVDLFCKTPDLSLEHPSVVTDSFYSDSEPFLKYGNHLYFKMVGRKGDKLYRIDSQGTWQEIVSDMQVIGSFQIVEKGILLLGLKDLNLTELFFTGPEGTKPLSGINNWISRRSLSQPVSLTCEADGVELDGFVYPPVNYEENRKYPAVLMIHGGPKMLYAPVYSHDIQLLCAEGYFVFCGNPMGSDGRGDDFARISGSFAEQPYRQLMAFTDEVLSLYPAIDKNRLGVTGGSYGGYLANYIITHTDRFKAAVTERGISDLQTAFTSSDIGPQYVGEYLGSGSDPWRNREKAIEDSPIYRADRVKTPTLFVHGKEDFRCMYTESLNMFNALNYHGVETSLSLFSGENHSLVVRGKPQSKMERYRLILQWFGRFLSGDNRESAK
ncbi:alpha/beta hydrolase family protein [Spirochaeta isovalerica]|uniref:Dipeptidyl aminopeptidase/acylaminoacyl peptidase n=1 Tax=Spirochaeta isovalerica TaxID=150 RepID=A0A841RGH1_9SPIO|nr:S9 family peptidase [Spirochaeta isovalerica]MBB6482666.1 dipeptidyl aminopeptidase/acylaminoacyl peptidase [Spirochaeta isovalerica]